MVVALAAVCFVYCIAIDVDICTHIIIKYHIIVAVSCCQLKCYQLQAYIHIHELTINYKTLILQNIFNDHQLCVLLENWT